MPHWVSACRWKWLFVIINPGNEGDVCPHSLRHAWLQSSSATQQSLFRSKDYQKSILKYSFSVGVAWFQNRYEVLCISVFNKVIYLCETVYYPQWIYLFLIFNCKHLCLKYFVGSVNLLSNLKVVHIPVKRNSIKWNSSFFLSVTLKFIVRSL